MQIPNSSSIMTQLNGSSQQYSDSKSIDKIRISIVDDSGVIREGLKIILQKEPSFDVVGMANNGRAAIETIEAQKPDVVLMDMEMPELDGISSTKIIKDRFPNTKVMVFSSHAENSYITKSLEAGAKGYFLKNTSGDEITQGIKNVYKGFNQLGPGLLENYISHNAELRASNSSLLPQEELQTSLAPIDSLVEIEYEEPIVESKPWFRRIIIGITLLMVALATSLLAIAKLKPELWERVVNNPTEPVVPTPAPAPIPTAVSALGKIEPEGEVVRLSVSSAAEGSRVDSLLVERGDTVKQGQIVAILDSYNRAEAALNKAQTDVRIAQANLERVQAGAKQGDINAGESAIERLKAELRGQVASQQAAISRLSAEFDNAKVEYNRYQQLFNDGAISVQQLDTKRLRLDTVKQQLAEAKETLNRTIETTEVERNEAQAKLESIVEVRAVDVRVAQAELEQSQAAVLQAQAALALTEVRSPMDGRVLEVNARPGEVVGNKGIIAIGQTDRMYVVAEVYETDIERVNLGQQAIVTGSAFNEELQGEVTQIGLEVKQQDVFESDPLVNTDNKVVEVKIRLNPESSKRVTALSNLQVQVVIAL